jgi:hypothetical protein
MWVMELGGVAMTEADMTAGEDELAFVLAARQLPHQWGANPPHHCPACLASHAVALLVSRGQVDLLVATQTVAAIPRAELIQAVRIEDPPAAETE